MNIEWDRSAVG